MSPPAHDESFFYIRFPLGKSTESDAPAVPKTEAASSTSSSSGTGSLTKALTGSGIHGGVDGVMSPVAMHEFDDDFPTNTPVDLSKECKKYLSGLENGEFDVE